MMVSCYNDFKTVINDLSLANLKLKQWQYLRYQPDAIWF